MFLRPAAVCLLISAVLGAQSSSDGGSPSPDGQPAKKPWVDLSSYVGSVVTRLDGGGVATLYERQNAALFANKTLGHFEFHSELEFEYSSDAAPVGGQVGPGAGTFGFETIWLNYNVRDWLQVRGGKLLTPTFWGVHHYPNVRLTVENPLVHERIFPANVSGAMVLGTHYYESGGFDYSAYWGKATGFEPSDVPEIGNSAFGGTFLAHIPSRHWFDTLDGGIQLYRDSPAGGMRKRIYGFQTQIEKDAFEFLGEFAHSSIGPTGGPRQLFREGYYLEPAWRLHPGWHAYYRYDWLKFDSRDAANPFNDEHTAGINYRPVAWVSLKLEGNWARPSGTLQPGRAGFGAGMAFFFHR